MLTAILALAYTSLAAADPSAAAAVQNAVHAPLPLALRPDEFEYVREDETTDVESHEIYHLSILLHESGLQIPFAYSDSEFAPLDVLGAWWFITGKLLLLGARNGPENASGRQTTERFTLIGIEEKGYTILKTDEITAYYRMGQNNVETGQIAYTAQETGSGVELIRTHTESSSNRDFNGPAPLCVMFEEGGYYRQYSLKTVTRYQVGAHDLESVGKKMFLDLSGLPYHLSDWEFPARDFSLEEVAEFLVLLLAPRYGGESTVLPSEKEKMIRDLKAQNPGLEEWPNMNREIALPPLHR